MPDLPEIDRAVERIERLLDEFSDPQIRAKAEELVGVLMEVYGAGLERIIELSDQAIFDRLVRDKLVASLLLIHGRHPLDAETRIREALAPIGSRVKGQRIVFEGIENGIARVRIDSNGGGGVPAGLAAAIEHAVTEAAPELDGVKVEVPATLVQIGLAPGA